MIRTEGLAVKSMIATISGTVLAIILDPIFLFGFKWGAAGVAFANVLGYALNTGLLIYFTWKDSKFLSFNPKYIKVSWHHFKEIIAIGIPSSVTNFMQTFGMVYTRDAEVTVKAACDNPDIQKLYAEFFDGKPMSHKSTSHVTYYLCEPF